MASGIGHHYGIDVSLVRIGFVVFTFTSGVGLMAYLLCWLIIPRAKFWPPVTNAKPLRAVSSREIGVGLLLLGFLVALFFSGGALAKTLVPLVLIAGGVWMLTQPDSAESESEAARARGVGATAGPQPFGPGAEQFDTGSQPLDGAGVPLPPGAMPRGTPVATSGRRVRRRLWLLPILAVLVIIPAGLILAIATADIQIDFSTVEVKPASVDAIPASIVEDQAELVVDLTELEPAMFEDGPVPLNIEVDFGRVEVIVPEGLNVDVDANVDIGDLTVFGSNEDGFEATFQISTDEPDLVLDANLGIGEMEIRTSDG